MGTKFCKLEICMIGVGLVYQFWPWSMQCGSVSINFSIHEYCYYIDYCELSPVWNE
jgi:hypothetical protein